MGRLRLKNTLLRLTAAPGARYYPLMPWKVSSHPTRGRSSGAGDTHKHTQRHTHTAPGTLPRLPRTPLWQRGQRGPRREAGEKGSAGAAGGGTAANGRRGAARDRPNAAAIPAAAAASARCRLGWALLGLAWLGSAWLASARLRASPGLCWVPAPAAPPVKPREGARAGCFFGEISPRSRRSKLTQNKCLPLID